MAGKFRVFVVSALALLPGVVSAQVNTQQWPSAITTDYGLVTLFQPQLEDFHDDQLQSRSAVSVQLNGQADPVFGAVWYQDIVSIDNYAKTVRILQVTVSRTRFPTDDPNLDRAVGQAVAQRFSGRQIVLNLDQLDATLDVLHKEQAASEQIQSAPPAIVFRDHPAVKLQYDGRPRVVQADNSYLFRAVNTPMFVALDPNTRTYYLKGGGRWFAAPDALGPFNQINNAPPEVAALATAGGYQDPQQPLNVDANAYVEIVTATDPTELVWTSGPAQWSPIAGTNLLYTANTDSDLFMLLGSGQNFVLISGRWYSAPNQNGPWTFVPPSQLPDDFRRISADGPKGGVLVSVPGTEAAQDAMADAYVPQTAAVDVNNFDQPPVVYDGNPQFAPVEGTELTYGVNTGQSVIFYGGQYYCCYNGVWYVAGSPVGRWGLCTSIPSVIYTIPPSCPIYSVRFCYIYGRGPGVIYCGYLPGYVGSYVYDGVLVYGTGYRYDPWFGRRYIARPCTYGFAAHYDWYTGNWGFDFAVALGGGSGWIAERDDRFRGGEWFGHDGFHPVYARDRAHVEDAKQRFTADHNQHVATVSVYDRRKDLHTELPGGAGHAPPPHGVSPQRSDQGRNAPPASGDRGSQRGNGQSNNPPNNSPNNPGQRGRGAGSGQRGSQYTPPPQENPGQAPSAGSGQADRGGQQGRNRGGSNTQAPPPAPSEGRGRSGSPSGGEPQPGEGGRRGGGSGSGGGGGADAGNSRAAPPAERGGAGGGGGGSGNRGSGSGGGQAPPPERGSGGGGGNRGSEGGGGAQQSPPAPPPDRGGGGNTGGAGGGGNNRGASGGGNGRGQGQQQP